MRHSPLLRWMIVLAVGSVLLAACGGDGDDPTMEADPADEATAAPDDGDDGDGDDGDGAGAGQDPDFAELASQGFASAARVTYEFTSEGAETQQLVLSSDGEQTAWLMPNARMIVRADGTQIMCTEGGQQTQCFQLSGQDPSGAAGAMAGATPGMWLANSFQEGVDQLPGFSRTGEREIAGRTATCGTFDPSQLAAGQDAGEATLCVDADTGVMLSYEATGGQGAASRFTAVEFGEPQASDFEVPAEPMQMDEMMDQMGQGESG